MLALTGSFLVAFIVRETYGGSMQHADGSELEASILPSA